MSDEDEHESEAAKSEADGSTKDKSDAASSCTLDNDEVASNAASEAKPIKSEPVAEMTW